MVRSRDESLKWEVGDFVRDLEMKFGKHVSNHKHAWKARGGLHSHVSEAL